MKKRLLVAMALMLMVLLSASMLVAQEKASTEKEKASCHKEMKLTDEQKTQVEDLKMNHRMKAIDLKAELEKLGITFKKEMMKPEPSMQELEGLVKKMSVIREKLQLSTIEHMLAMRKLLGPDWRMHKRDGMGDCFGPMGAAGMGMPGKGECCPMMRAPMPMSGKGAGCGMGGCMMMQKGNKGSSHMSGNWRQKMFRAHGKKSGCCPGMGDMKGGCKGMGDMEGGCKGMGNMKGGCPGMGAMKGGCKGMGGMKEGAAKEAGECHGEMKKETKK